MHIRPVDMPELRDETIKWATDEVSQKAIEVGIRAGRQPFVPKAASVSASAKMLCLAEASRLRTSELFHVSSEMSDLAVASGRSLPEFSLTPEDVPVPNGFAYFEKPLTVIEDTVAAGSPVVHVPIVAASWSPWTDGLWVTWYTSSRAMLDEYARIGIYSAKDAEKICPTIPHLSPNRNTQWPFGTSLGIRSSDGGEFSSLKDARAAGAMQEPVTVLKAAWLLMAQPGIATVTDAQFDRAARRRMPKDQEPPRVRVITLRRPSGSSSGDSDREYHHQWIVRGHWRQHWYPARQVHRPVWIAPHVKGPEGAPLLGGEKVYAWKR
jgi:hypothetical protein